MTKEDNKIINLSIYGCFETINLIDVTKGTIIVLGCGNLSNHSTTINALRAKYNSYDEELILKSTISSFYTVYGSSSVSKINDKLSIVTIYAEILTPNKEKKVSLDVLANGFRYVNSMLEILPEGNIYIPLFLGTEMNKQLWQICFSIINIYMKKAIITTEGKDFTEDLKISK